MQEEGRAGRESGRRRCRLWQPPGLWRNAEQAIEVQRRVRNGMGANACRVARGLRD